MSLHEAIAAPKLIIPPSSIIEFTDRLKDVNKELKTLKYFTTGKLMDIF